MHIGPLWTKSEWYSLEAWQLLLGSNPVSASVSWFSILAETRGLRRRASECVGCVLK